MNYQARASGNLERRIHEAERDLFAAVGADVEEFFLDLARTGLRVRVPSPWTRPGGCPAPRRVGERRHLGAVVSAAPWFPAARRGPSRSRLVRPGRLPARAGARARPRADRGHPGRARARRGAGDRPLAWRHVRAVARSRRFRADLSGGRDRRARRRAPGRPRAHAAVTADRPRTRRRRLALTQPASCLPPPARPGARRRRRGGRAGPADRGAAPVRTPAGNARTVASLMHAIDRFRHPRPESVLTSAELAAITTPTIFILGSDDPYLSIERARPRLQIHGARLYEVPGGHAPWLAGARHAAELIATHAHLAAGPTPAIRAGPKPCKQTHRPDRQQQKSRTTLAASPPRSAEVVRAGAQLMATLPCR